jgi:hypothetical protein
MRSAMCDFMVACEAVLKEHDLFKGVEGWRVDCSTDSLIKSITTKTSELEAAGRSKRLKLTKDIANLSMMVYDRDTKGCIV